MSDFKAKRWRLPASRTAETLTGHASKAVHIAVFANNNHMSSFTRSCYKLMARFSRVKTALQGACGPLVQCNVICCLSVALFGEGVAKTSLQSLYTVHDHPWRCEKTAKLTN